MLTPVQRVLILKGADLLKDVGPRHLVGLATVAREIEIWAGDTIYTEDDPADALYMVVEGRVRLMIGERTTSEVGPGEAFGTWSLVDDSARGHRAECVEDGLTLALHRDEFYDVAAGDLTLLQEILRALARRLRALVSERPEEARVEGEGIEKPESLVNAETAGADLGVVSPSVPGASLTAAALGQPPDEEIGAVQPPPPETKPSDTEVPALGQDDDRERGPSRRYPAPDVPSRGDREVG